MLRHSCNASPASLYQLVRRISLRQYCYVNNRSEIIEKDDLKAWEERMMRLGFIDEKQQAAFRRLCDNIQAGSESFATTLRTTLMSKGERMDVLRFRGQTIYNGEERVLTIGLIT